MMTQRQKQVLCAVDYFESEVGRPAYEDDVWRIGLWRRQWPAQTTLYGHLKRLADKGLLNRLGKRGGYSYTLTADGREAIGT
jgi:DNA-binding PadR family transcriptional regulator